jgi:hypothetical protein
LFKQGLDSTVMIPFLQTEAYPDITNFIPTDEACFMTEQRLRKLTTQQLHVPSVIAGSINKIPDRDVSTYNGKFGTYFKGQGFMAEFYYGMD